MIAVILARGGSKRILRKNIRPFVGRPMISYAIAAARNSGLFRHIVVSTDDSEIADFARREGAEVPFIRPAELSDDFTPTVPVMAHAIHTCISIGWKVDIACCIYSAVPFLEIADMINALSLLQSSGADYCFPITEFLSPVQRALRRNIGGRMTPLYPEFEQVRSQDLEPAYYDAGQFYWGSKDAWLHNPNIFSSGVGYPIPHWRVVDIDTENDWVRAESMFYYLRKKNRHG